LFKILLKNLFENAIKYWKKWEKIEIILNKKSFLVKNKINKNNLKIKIEKIFDSFYQNDISRNTMWYGLWLSIVKKIINLHNFSIKAEIKKDFFIINIIF
jgi:signal transduction histidine kinase